MIEFLEGLLAQKYPARLVVQVAGIGFGVDVTLRTAEAAPAAGETVRLLTYLHVKEDLLELYGFLEAQEREVFLRLLGVSGIGPKLALRVLSSASPAQLARLILAGDVRGLMALKGIGKKTAEVMIASLRTAMQKLDLRAEGSAAKAGPETEAMRDAIMALVTLGVKDAAAQAAVQKAKEKLGDKADAGRLIAQALQEV